MGYYSSFVVRIRVSKSDNVLRGYIQGVHSRDGQYFSDMDKMVQYMMSHLGSPMNNHFRENGFDEESRDRTAPDGTGASSPGKKQGQ